MTTFKQPTLQFSALASEEKQKYIDFLLSNNVKFTQGQQNDFVAKIKIYSDRQSGYNQDENRNSSNNIRSKSPREVFMQAKKSSRSSSKISRSSSQISRSQSKISHSQVNQLQDNSNLYYPSHNKSSIHKVQNKIQTATVIPGIEELYPEFYRNIKAIDVWMRPKKLSRDSLMLQIEEIYSSRFQEATNKIQNKKQNSPQETLFPQYVYQLIRQNLKHDRQTQQRSIDLLASVEYHSIKYLDVQIFKKFLCREYTDEILMFFLFLRAIIEKEQNISIYNCIILIFIEDSRKNVVNLSQVWLNFKQIQTILQLVYGSEETEQIEFMLQVCDAKINNFNDKLEPFNANKRRLSCLDLMNLALVKYHNDRQKKNTIVKTPIIVQNLTYLNSLQNEQIELDPLQFIIQKEVFIQLQNFLNDNVGTLDMQEQLQSIVGDLLQALFKYDKMIWFSRIQLQEPNQNDLLYIENLQKSYRRMQRTNLNDNQEVHIFAKRILQTPQLAKTIGKVLQGD